MSGIYSKNVSISFYLVGGLEIMTSSGNMNSKSVRVYMGVCVCVHAKYMLRLVLKAISLDDVRWGIC